MKLIDMHCHIVPGVDDGSRNKKETLRMLEMMKEQGVIGIIATPHYHIGYFETELSEIEKRFYWTKHMAQEYGIHMWLGTECYVESEMIARMDKNKYNRMAESQHLLVEFSRINSYNTIRQYLNILIAEGYIPIMAHVERVPELVNDITYVSELRALGVKIQVNAESVLGTGGLKSKRYVWKLIKLDLVDYIASDSHNCQRRVPNLGDCYKAVEKKMGRKYADRIFYRNPKKIICDERD